jgi:predicted aldo/keto reductase-like oxidoreductase
MNGKICTGRKLKGRFSSSKNEFTKPLNEQKRKLCTDYNDCCYIHAVLNF